MWLPTAIFAVTYVLIVARRSGLLRLDRPAVALLGAVAMVACGVLSPREALRAVDDETIALLFGVMGIGAFLDRAGFFERGAALIAARIRTGTALCGAVVWGMGVVAALVTNDAVCLLGVPLIVRVVVKSGLPPLPFLLAVASAANTGSAATLVGNPQNMLCATLGGLEYASYLVVALPVTVASLAVNHALLVLLFRAELAVPLTHEPAPRFFDREMATVVGVLVATTVLYAAGAPLAFTALGGFGALLALVRPPPGEVWRRIDFSLLVFFAGLFIVVAGLEAGGGVAALFERFPLSTFLSEGGALGAGLFFLVGSNVVSNVPFILVVEDEVRRSADPTTMWQLLALASTFAGNLTLLGSAANVIVAEKGREVGGLPFFAHLRVGLPLALATTAIAAGWIELLAWLRG